MCVMRALKLSIYRNPDKGTCEKEPYHIFPNIISWPLSKSM